VQKLVFEKRESLLGVCVCVCVCVGGWSGEME